MIVVDVEATGVDYHKHSLLSIGAIDFRNPENQFYIECRMFDGAHVMDEALAVAGFTRAEIADPKKVTVEEAIRQFLVWSENAEEHMLAGQNPSFDRDFLKASAERAGINWPMAHRTLDLHSVCYFHILKRGIPVPMENNRSALNLDKILEYVGIPARPEGMPHNALTDATVSAEALHRLFYDEPLLNAFTGNPIPWIGV